MISILNYNLHRVQEPEMNEEKQPITKEESRLLVARIRKLEDYFFAFKVLSSAVIAVSIFIGWVVQNWENIKKIFH